MSLRERQGSSLPQPGTQTPSPRSTAIAAIRPFRGLRYGPAIPPDAVIAPPYDVVGSDDVRALLDRSPYNVAHVESCPGADETRYELAAEALRRWQDERALLRDEQPAYYVYEQRFTVGGADHTRRCFFARMRLHPPGDGVVRLHEATMAGPKQERLKLLRATGVNVSPIFAMFDDREGTALTALNEVARGEPVFEAKDARGCEHRLWPVRDEAQMQALTAAVAASPVTIADGHHRYETALLYAQEQRSEAARWVLTGLIGVNDPGLLILPNHRLVRTDQLSGDLLDGLAQLYEIEDVTPEAPSAAAVRRLWERVQANAGGATTFGVIGIEGQRLHLLTARSGGAIDGAMPAAWSAASRSLDVLILTETILRPLLGIEQATLDAGDRVGFTSEAEDAWRKIEDGHYQLAFLVNAVRVEQVIAVADAGELMPQKATFFYPKLATGMVLNPVD